MMLSPDMSTSGRISARHNNRANVGFLDGHVDSFSAAELNVRPQLFGWTNVSYWQSGYGLVRLYQSVRGAVRQRMFSQRV